MSHIPPAVHLTPGRCHQCGRFVSRDAAPHAWAVEVGEHYQQVPGKPNLFARTSCDECRYVTPRRPLSWAWTVPMEDVLARAAELANPPSEEA